ncbi:epoxide hydrolase 1-related [Holotrichia oblita]|uniref:Epoxide hydrolase 1-related n=1 Tax=Holotrichia oblita TaxID=644536 RepID=A0ACB9TYN2_HOLOL|nr:epoxide hydrolase 1-related [Holotrichia oblita]
MGLFARIFLVVSAISIILIGLKINRLLEVPPLPVLENTWWGPGDPKKVDTSIRPFKINIPQKSNIVEFHQNWFIPQSTIELKTIYPTLRGYPTSIRYKHQIVIGGRRILESINQYPQFKTNIQGLDIHFLHVKPTNTKGLKVLPLLLLHGWPGSVREFYELIPLLTKPQPGKDFVFEIIAPSLPGYGFSDAAAKPGLSAVKMSAIFRNLMHRLGFNKFYIQGGDWGAIILANMATLYPEDVLGAHSNACLVSYDNPMVNFKLLLGSIFPSLVVSEAHKSKMYPISSVLEFTLRETGYMHLQATKPDTIGVGLNDSPVGLAAYLVEKFTVWTNRDWVNRADGGLKLKFDYFKILDMVTIYWVTNSITTSARLYAETLGKELLDLRMGSIPITVPTACAKFKNELFYQSDELLKHKYTNLLQSSDIEDGGHFAALEVIDDLNQRLKNARPFTPPLEGVQQQYGMNTKLLSEIVEFWKTKYDWKERQTFLNQFPQFKTNIQGLDIHFLHVKPTNAKNLKVLPILLLHGWPGSIREFYELIPLLIKPQSGKDFVFEVIAPSLPGYGFSDGASKPGLSIIKMSLIFKNLMHRLGFKKFYIHGGDVGGGILANMITLYPEDVLGGHSNGCIVMYDNPIVNFKLFLGSIFPPLVVPKEHESKMYPISNVLEFNIRETGYMHIQATKPDTVGVGLNDSPVGLAAYIIEKFTTWTNRDWINRMDGGLLMKYDYTKLLDNVMIYWVTNSITTSVRVYAETLGKELMEMKLGSIPTDVPMACARFENEIFYQSDELLKHKFTNLLQTSDISDGGHFAALEVPQLVAEDLWSACAKFISYQASIK